MDAVEKRARELLAAECHKHGFEFGAYQILEGSDLPPFGAASLNAIIAALTPPEGYVPQRAMLRVATGLREKASRSARPLERKTLIASAEALEKAVSAARPEVQP